MRINQIEGEYKQLGNILRQKVEELEKEKDNNQRLRMKLEEMRQLEEKCFILNNELERLNDMIGQLNDENAILK